MYIRFQMSEDWNAKGRGRDVTTASESELRNEMFLGDLVLYVRSKDFSAHWGWIPLLDCAYCLKNISDEIMSGQRISVFDFTESDASITFTRDGDNVIVSASYAKEVAEIEHQKICFVLTSTARELFKQVREANSELSFNQSFQLMWGRVMA